ncbi:Thioredoxin-like protein [Ophiocordyceps camponoti-floridani]|uniref:Thioredoxin-like protein n=1 Tax=Ophiocordyceps camponoti-floridani TaxID=2030778 RepID=A0A8H4VFP1_9HYPO|nr:Thioredoxin-like protein [Ophiocordyceps camponoti-floridani]
MRVAIPRIFVNRLTSLRNPPKTITESPSLHINSEEDFTSLLKSNTYVVVNFTTSWTPSCRGSVDAIYDTLACNHSIPESLAFGRVNVDRFEPIARKYGVTILPSYVFFQHAKQVSVNKHAMIRGADIDFLIVACDRFRELAVTQVIKQAKPSFPS